MNTETTLPPHLESIGRQLTAAHGLNLPPRRRPSRLILAPIAVAAVIVAVVLGTTALSGGGTVAGPLPHLTASTVLARAADVALQTSALTPSPDQFVYDETESGGQTVRSWLSVDGTHAGSEQFGKSAPMTLPPGSPPAYYPEMPTNPNAIWAFLLKTGNAYPLSATKTETDVLNNLAKNIGWILESDYLQPAQQAALYQFIATTPGITIEQNVKDITGRPGIGVGWSFYGSSAMLIFDPTTYQYLGMTTVGTGGQVGGAALLQKAVVDTVGEQPPAGSATRAEPQGGTGTSTAGAAHD